MAVDAQIDRLSGIAAFCVSEAAAADGRSRHRRRSLRIAAHQAFVGRERAIRENYAISSAINLLERMEARQKIAETDIGEEIRKRVEDLRLLLSGSNSRSCRQAPPCNNSFYSKRIIAAPYDIMI